MCDGPGLADQMDARAGVIFIPWIALQLFQIELPANQGLVWFAQSSSASQSEQQHLIMRSDNL